MAVFPKEFVWGAATAAYQIEGGAVEDGKGRSIWDVFSHTPGRTYRGETGDTACDSYHRWREDIELLKSMHLKAYRFSVAWTRIAPTGGTDWNEKGFAYYDGLVNTLLEAGIEPYITLYHWDLPQALEEKGGWQNEDTARAFAVYTAKMAEHFKGRVHQWFTFNEPACIVKMGYGTGEHAPGLKLPLEGQFTCWQNIIYAHCLAAQELRHTDAENRVGFVSTGRICYPASEAKADVDAARALTFACPDEDCYACCGKKAFAFCGGCGTMEKKSPWRKLYEARKLERQRSAVVSDQGLSGICQRGTAGHPLPAGDEAPAGAGGL